MSKNEIAEAIRESLSSPNVVDDNWEAANVVDVLQKVARGLHHIARAIEFAALYEKGCVSDNMADAVRKRLEESGR